MSSNSPVRVLGFAPTPTAQSCDNNHATLSPKQHLTTGLARTRSLLSELMNSSTQNWDSEDEDGLSAIGDAADYEYEDAGNLHLHAIGHCTCGVGAGVSGHLHAAACRLRLAQAVSAAHASNSSTSSCSSPSSPVPIPTKTYYRNQAQIDERAKLQYQRTVYRLQLEKQQAQLAVQQF